MIKWDKKDVIKAFQEAMSPQQAQLTSPAGVLDAIRRRGNGILRRPTGIKEPEPTRGV